MGGLRRNAVIIFVITNEVKAAEKDEPKSQWTAGM
jgi:hypothetical protein